MADRKSGPLREVLSDINGWASTGFVPLNPEIVKNLQLDDYVNERFSNGKDIVSLYIGYYLGLEKIGAAHDPLVCFPGQGWELSGIQKGKLSLEPNRCAPIEYSSMEASNGTDREWIVYWFQSYDRATPDTLSQKLTSLWQKMLHQREDSAFVRLSMSLGNRSTEESRQPLFDFVRSFYPGFLAYVRE